MDTSIESAALEILPAQSDHQRRLAAYLLTAHLPADLAVQRQAEIESHRPEVLLLLAQRTAAAGNDETPQRYATRPLGAVFAVPLPGKTCMVWPPRLASGESLSAELSLQIAARLLRAVVQSQVEQGTLLVQAMLAEADDAAPFLAAGFEFVANLLYLHADCRQQSTFPEANLALERVAEDDWPRFAQLLERTYQRTRDCPAIHQHLHVSDTLESYRGQPGYAPHLWFMVHERGSALGCLILAAHSSQLWELVYMGITPEARGAGRGIQIVQHALNLAHRSGVSQLALAVDSANEPAVNIYRQCGFEPFDRLRIYIAATSR